MGAAFAIILIPIVIVVRLIAIPFDKATERSPAEVLSYLRNFYDGTGDDYDWDDFTSVSISNAELEDIRASAASLDLPMGDGELSSLRALIGKVEAMVAQRPTL